ncbi:MAG: alpha/beta fold hydrolase [Chloroflexi bacterium]|nr:alpha/beta fold hydrolase [Chloroflexota bacterium]
MSAAAAGRTASRMVFVHVATWLGGAVVLLGVLVAAWSRVAEVLLARPLAPPAGDPGCFASVDGVRTYYRVQGQGSPLVLVHGLGSSHLTWAAITDALAEHFTVYVLDLPGFGYSDKPPGYASARQEAAFVDCFLATLGIERATVIGHSMGGAVALWLAAEHPARIERVVLVNAIEIGDAAAIFRLIAQPILGELLLKTTTPATMRLLLADPYVHKEVVTPELARQYARFAWTPGARQALIEHARSYNADRAALRPRLAQVTVRALIIWTDHDPYFPVSVAHDLLDALPSAHLEVIRDTGHLPQEEQPTRFSQIVLDWLIPLAAPSESLR